MMACRRTSLACWHRIGKAISGSAQLRASLTVMTAKTGRPIRWRIEVETTASGPLPRTARATSGLESWGVLLALTASPGKSLTWDSIRPTPMSQLHPLLLISRAACGQPPPPEPQALTAPTGRPLLHRTAWQTTTYNTLLKTIEETSGLQAIKESIVTTAGNGKRFRLQGTKE